MKISELPTEIKEKALEYQRNADAKHCNKYTNDLMWAFAWKLTIEGYDYWKALHSTKKKKPIKTKL